MLAIFTIQVSEYVGQFHRSILMKNNPAAPLTALALAFSATLLGSQPSPAQSRQFFCGLSNDYPTTMVRNPRGIVPLIAWTDNSWINDTLTPRRRCQEVANRFQDFHDKGQLRVLKAGRVNDQPVICGLGSNQESCNSSNVLLTVSKDRNPDQVLDQLLNTRITVSGQPVFLSGNQEGRIKPQNGADGFASVNFEAFLNDTSDPPGEQAW